MGYKALFIAIVFSLSLFDTIKIQAQSRERVYCFGYACSITWDSNLAVRHKIFYISNMNDFDKKTSIAWQSVNTNPQWKNHFRNSPKPYPNNEFADYFETKFDYQSAIARRNELISWYQKKGFEIHEINDFVIPPKDIPENNRASQSDQPKGGSGMNGHAVPNMRSAEQSGNAQSGNSARYNTINKTEHDAAVTAYYAKKRSEIQQKGAEDLANIAAEGLAYFAAQRQASKENAERYRQQFEAEKQEERERLAAEEEEKERIREERAAAKAEAERLENERILAEQTFRTNSRNAVFSSFREADIPLSNSNVGSDKLYYFIYAYNLNTISGENFEVYLSPPFEIGRYSDGTWPYKKNVMNEIASLTPFKETLHGYYTSEEEARKMYNTFTELLANTNVRLRPISYKGKVSSLTPGKQDNFWGEQVSKGKTNELKSTKSEKPAKKTKELDFWGNPIAK